jgi:aminopeptidase-like protein
MSALSPHELECLFDRLWPLPRSITGPGFRESLCILEELVPFVRHEHKTGSQVLDWRVPQEWHPRAAWIEGPDGQRHCDFAVNNLHLLGYSTPFRGELDLADLQAHLYSLPEQPDAIPYLTSYYAPRWGFCLSHREREQLPPGRYRIVIDSELSDGAVISAEAILPGDEPGEILFSSYLCHPSMANNELSGPLVLTSLYRALAARPSRRYTCRFVLGAETIGSICYLARVGDHLRKELRAGFVLTCCGDRGHLSYKRSRRGDCLADRAALLALRDRGCEHEVIPFTPALGSDERQFCSPGFDLPVGSLMRTMYTRFPEYHTSLDNKSFISFEHLADTVEAYLAVVEALEANRVWRNTCPFGEPQLGPRGLFRSLGSQKEVERRDTAMWWALNLADGQHDLLAMAARSGCAIADLAAICAELASAGLLVEEG